MNSPAGFTGDDRLARPVTGRQFGRYEILTQLATGGMASVFIGRAQRVAGFERLVAIKVLHPHLAYEQEFISMFLDEARLAARIHHTNVVPTLDISDSPGDGYFLVMEYIEGNHLGALLSRAAKQGRRLPRPFVLRVLIDALQGLGAAHRLADENGRPLKLVHRDVSPHNILVGTDGIARLTDFGVAKADVRMASTRAGQFKGKLSYMAPEQASSNETDQRSDLFSVGVILWESLTGRRLFKGESNGATLNKLLNEPIAKPSELLPELQTYDEVVMKALDRDPARRFQTAEALAEALDAVAGSSGISKAREVAAFVRSLDAEKLEDERKRIREAIALLGHAEIAASEVPMPRDSTGRISRAQIETAGTESHVQDRVSGPHSRSNVSQEGGSRLQRWLLILLGCAMLVSAVLVAWRWSRPEAAAAGDSAEPKPDPEPSRPPTQSAAAAAPTEPAVEPEPPSPQSTEPAQLEGAPERTNRTTSQRIRRRRAQGGARQARSPSTQRAPGPEPAASHPSPEPVDIDIANPYRN